MKNRDNEFLRDALRNLTNGFNTVARDRYRTKYVHSDLVLSFLSTELLLQSREPRNLPCFQQQMSFSRSISNWTPFSCAPSSLTSLSVLVRAALQTLIGYFLLQMLWRINITSVVWKCLKIATKKLGIWFIFKIH